MAQRAPPLDIELPLSGNVDGDLTESKVSMPWMPLPFLVDMLLLAKPDPFGLEIEVKSDDRVVAAWNIEVNPRNGGRYVSQAKAGLYVCASAKGDARATGAFLVIRQWWVNVSDDVQLDQLYTSLGAATLERLNSLMGGFANTTGELRSCVLYLLDDRRLERKLMSLDRLQAELLSAIDSDGAIAGIGLRIAHGRGTGNSSVSTTIVSGLQSENSALVSHPHLRRPTPESLAGQVAVVQTESSR